MEKSNSRKILFKFFEGKHTTFEGKMIEEWLQDDENKELYFEYLHEWELRNPQVQVDLEAKFATLNGSWKKQSKSLEMPEEEIPSRFPWKRILKAAAVLLVCFCAGAYLYTSLAERTKGDMAYQKQVDALKNGSGEIFEKENVSEKPLLVNLPDGSSILLQAGAKISYNPKTFGVERRELILGGEAFFEVYKDSSKPFVVYANDLIAKVLGTSFTIKAKPGSDKTEVLVKTGKVAVFTQTDLHKSEKIEGKALEGLVLNPLEKVEVNGKESRISKPATVAPKDLSQDIETLNFNFDETAAEQVFATLEQAYKVDIVYDRASLADSKLTAHLGDEPLGEKLKLICLALEVSFQEIDEKIVIFKKE
ncbi:FecR domain-containing protein [Marinilongibacter aquaticus]|uniref:FecR family protein n=1 Tax=Marinilongibacter aquaticus TaxID=2975157 RepID=UPI0021BD88ED|nr:FecR family protein [Marinilongibacter aquaticus]UBM59189.1 FecR domain-containing protein [Marinilongibacter aquaticus]